MPHMLTGEEIKLHIENLKGRHDRKQTSTDRDIGLLLLAAFQIAAELDDIRYMLRKSDQSGTSAPSTR